MSIEVIIVGKGKEVCWMGGDANVNWCNRGCACDTRKECFCRCRLDLGLGPWTSLCVTPTVS